MLVQEYGIDPSMILATEFDVEENGQVIGWKRDTLIHMLNKREMGHKELSVIRDQRPNVVLVGDVPDDVHMVEGDNVLRIRVIDPRKGETYDADKVIQQSFDVGFDLVVMDSLAPVASMMSALIAT
jgi:hypothetical protein